MRDHDKLMMWYKQNLISKFRYFTLYRTKMSDLLSFRPIHWHEEVEIRRIVSGEGKCFVGNKWYSANAGQIFIIPPFALHTVEIDGDCDIVTETILLSLRMIEDHPSSMSSLKYLAPLLNSHNNTPIIIKECDAIFRAVDDSLLTIFGSAPSQGGYELSIKANLLWIFFHVFNSEMPLASGTNVDDKKTYAIKLALQTIHSNYTSTITIDSVAEKCGYSPYYFMKLFKQTTSITFVQYLNNYRLSLAGELLLTTEDDISTIAKKVGYNNVSYFNRQFLHLYGVTPTQFKG